MSLRHVGGRLALAAEAEWKGIDIAVDTDQRGVFTDQTVGLLREEMERGGTFSATGRTQQQGRLSRTREGGRVESMEAAFVQIETDFGKDIEIEDFAQEIDTLTADNGRLVVLYQQSLSEVVVVGLRPVFVPDVAWPDVGGLAVRQEMEVRRTMVGLQMEIDAVSGGSEEE